MVRRYAKLSISKGENTLLELENNFLELKDREQKDRKQKIKREIENYFMSSLLCLKMTGISFKNKK